MRAKCNHVYSKEPNIKCGKDIGHNGLHYFLKDVGQKNNEDQPIMIYEWNDKSETYTGNEREQGRAFSVNYTDGYNERKKIMSLAIADAKTSLPLGTVFEIRSKTIPRNHMSDYNRQKITKEYEEKNWGIAWYYLSVPPEGFESQGMKQYPLFVKDVDDGEEPGCGGYVLLARIKNEK